MAKQQVDDKTIAEYLLGATSESETERLDEMSLTDDDFAERLRNAENDLVDAYARGELSGEDREKFINHYLASPRRRDKVRLAETLVAYADQPASTRQAAPGGFKSRDVRGDYFTDKGQRWQNKLAAFLLYRYHSQDEGEIRIGKKRGRA